MSDSAWVLIQPVCIDEWVQICILKCAEAEEVLLCPSNRGYPLVQCSTCGWISRMGESPYYALAAHWDVPRATVHGYADCWKAPWMKTGATYAENGPHPRNHWVNMDGEVLYPLTPLEYKEASRDG